MHIRFWKQTSLWGWEEEDMLPRDLESETPMGVGNMMTLTFVYYFMKLATLPTVQSTHPWLKYKCFLNTTIYKFKKMAINKIQHYRRTKREGQSRQRKLASHWHQSITAWNSQETALQFNYI